MHHDCVQQTRVVRTISVRYFAICWTQGGGVLVQGHKAQPRPLVDPYCPSHNRGRHAVRPITKGNIIVQGNLWVLPLWLRPSSLRKPPPKAEKNLHYAPIRWVRLKRAIEEALWPSSNPIISFHDLLLRLATVAIAKLCLPAFSVPRKSLGLACFPGVLVLGCLAIVDTYERSRATTPP